MISTPEVSIDSPAASFAGVGNRGPLLLIAGPCVVESEALCLQIATVVRDTAKRLGIPYVFKASYDKANRTSIKGFRGDGLEAGLAVLKKVRNEVGVPVLTDVHESADVARVAEVVDVLQVPAFLCRQTDLLLACGRSGKVVNIKKGQFVAPHDIHHAVNKVRTTGNSRVVLTERGFTFGYNNLVVDMRAIPVMQRTAACPVIFDAGHSVQTPGGMGGSSGGDRGFIPTLAQAAIAAGADGLFIETHPDPDKALSDGPNSYPLAELPTLLQNLVRLAQLVRTF